MRVHHVAFYILSAFVAKGLVGLAYPLLSHYAQPQDLGAAAVVLSTAGLVGMVLRLGFPNVLVSRWNGLLDRRQKEVLLAAFHSRFHAAFALTFAAAAAVVLADVALFGHLRKIYIVLSTIAAFGILLNHYFFISEQLYSLEKKTNLVSLLNILKGFIYALVIWLCVQWDRAAVAAVLAPVAGSAVWFVAYAVREPASLVLFKRPVGAPPVVRQGFPYMLSSLVTGAVFAIDRWVLAAYAGVEQVAIYEVAWRIGIVYDFIVANTFNMFFVPIFLAKFKQDALTGIRLVKLVVLALIGLIFVVISVPDSLFSWTANFLGEAYGESVHYIRWVIVLFVLAHMMSLVQLIFTAFQGGRHVFYMASVRLLVASAAYLILIPTYGVFGAVTGALIGYAVSILIGAAMFYLFVWPERRHDRDAVAEGAAGSNRV